MAVSGKLETRNAIRMARLQPLTHSLFTKPLNSLPTQPSFEVQSQRNFSSIELQIRANFQ
jgi:hypothetical protein